MTQVAHYLAIDPGHMNGYALFNEQGDIIDFGQFPMEKMVEQLQKLVDDNELKHIIVEDYINRAYGNFRQTGGGRNETSKMIGKIETVAELNNIPITKQPNANYAIGAMWGGFTIPSNHSISHQYVAAAHGIFYLQTHGIREAGRAMNKEK